MSNNMIQVDISELGPDYEQYSGQTITLGEAQMMYIHKMESARENVLIPRFSVGKYSNIFQYVDTQPLMTYHHKMIPEDLRNIVQRQYSFFTILHGEIIVPSQYTPDIFWDYIRSHPEILKHRLLRVRGEAFKNSLQECNRINDAIDEYAKKMD